ncbi:MAG: DUF4115 domain-containing protein [Alphaproteobacteria bacterium]|nr:DUF4115 domain-containing protein [Alphaproteobacteria bacterium]
MMPRKKKETLVHLDLETLSKETSSKKQKTEEEVDTSLGGVLRKAREKKKQTTAQIAKKLCIKEMYLDALEQGHYYVFPGLTYGIGFLRTYARFLGLDANEMVEKFHMETSSIKVEPMEMPIQQNANLMPSGRTVFKGIIVLVILYLIWYICINISHLNSKEVSVDSNEFPIVVEETLILEETVLENDDVEQTSEKQIVKENQEQIVTVKENIVQEAPIIADTVSKNVKKIEMKKSGLADKLWSKITPSKVYGVQKQEGLSFVATEEVWVKIMQDDKVILEEILYKGDRYNVPANTDYTLTTANAGALMVYINDKKTKTLGAKGALIENVALSADNFN